MSKRKDRVCKIYSLLVFGYVGWLLAINMSAFTLAEETGNTVEYILKFSYLTVINNNHQGFPYRW